MPSTRLLKPLRLPAAVLICPLLICPLMTSPAEAQVLTGGPYRVGDRIVRNGVVEQVVAGPFFENHTGSQPVPAASNPPISTDTPAASSSDTPAAINPADSPSTPAAPQGQDDDSDPNCCLQPGSEIWEQLVELIRENGRLEANLEKQEEIHELKFELAGQRMRQELAEQARRLERQMGELQEARERAERQTREAHERAEQLLKSRNAAPAQADLQQLEKLKARLQQQENQAAEQLAVAAERTTDLEKQLSTTKHHLDEARRREQSWDKERQKLKREIAELKKRRK